MFLNFGTLFDGVGHRCRVGVDDALFFKLGSQFVIQFDDVVGTIGDEADQ